MSLAKKIKWKPSIDCYTVIVVTLMKLYSEKAQVCQEGSNNIQFEEVEYQEMQCGSKSCTRREEKFKTRSNEQ